MNDYRRLAKPLALPTAALAACVAGAWFDARQVLASWLFAWLFALGLSLGALANLMLHTLTGGRWGALLYEPLAAAARLLPLVALLSLPLWIGVSRLYPWVDGASLDAVIHKTWWLNPGFFTVRSVAYLLIWNALGAFWLSAARRASPESRRRLHAMSAAGLIAYGLTMSLAAVDWIGSLVPQWYSSGFGLLVVIGQMLAAMAFGIAAAARQDQAGGDAKQSWNDLGNLLLMYVMTWAYLAFTQFLIIWAENLPREISWYLPRVQTGWRWLGIFLAVFHFFVPLLILLSRHAKRSPRRLGMLAVAVLSAHLADVFWMVAPSLRPSGFSIAWTDVAALAGIGGLWISAWTTLVRRPPARATAAERSAT